jgi:hypothetical protein
MLIKEENMRRLVFAAVLIAMLVVPASVLAEEPQLAPVPDGWWILGEVWWTPDEVATDLMWAPFERVDAFMTRPSTLGGWPLTQAPIMGTWWWTGPASEQRRMSYAEDWKFANMFGGYYAEFMLPRDEVWFPCSYPLKWKCNYVLGDFSIEYHSPAAMAYECRWLNEITLVCLDWPWIVAPYDTISPVVIDIFNSESPFPMGYQYELEIAGYFWKYSDFE